MFDNESQLGSKHRNKSHNSLYVFQPLIYIYIWSFSVVFLDSGAYAVIVFLLTDSEHLTEEIYEQFCSDKPSCCHQLPK